MPPSDHDRSNGWEAVAHDFIAARARGSVGIDVVRKWATQLPSGTSVLDLGCGNGIPVSLSLIEDGFEVYGVDAAPTMVEAFARRFPRARVVCEPAEDSTFFGRTFDGIVAIGLMSLLSPDAQRRLIRKVTSALKPGGYFLFTSPFQTCKWADLTTGQESRSLGADMYKQLLAESGLSVASTYVDEGHNHYFNVQRTRRG